MALPIDTLQKQLLAATRAEIGHDTKLVQAKGYARLMRKGKTLAYLSGSKKLRLDVGPNGRAGRVVVATADDVPAAVKALAEAAKT
jgi:hypothetical protein